MKTLQFKTNIKCGGCIAQVTPHLNAETNIEKWQVDTANPNKLLTVEGEVEPSEVIQAVKTAGFQAELVK